LEIERLIQIMKILGIIMNAFIVIVYSLSLYWNIKLLLTTVWVEYSWIKLGMAIVSLGFVVAYGYLLHNNLTVDSVATTIFGAMIVRPLVLLQGSLLAASARAKNTIAKHGGETWILRKYKTLLDG